METVFMICENILYDYICTKLYKQCTLCWTVHKSRYCNKESRHPQDPADSLSWSFWSLWHGVHHLLQLDLQSFRWNLTHTKFLFIQLSKGTLWFIHCLTLPFSKTLQIFWLRLSFCSGFRWTRRLRQGCEFQRSRHHRLLQIDIVHLSHLDIGRCDDCLKDPSIGNIGIVKWCSQNQFVFSTYLLSYLIFPTTNAIQEAAAAWNALNGTLIVLWLVIPGGILPYMNCGLQYGTDGLVGRMAHQPSPGMDDGTAWSAFEAART